MSLCCSFGRFCDQLNLINRSSVGFRGCLQPSKPSANSSQFSFVDFSGFASTAYLKDAYNIGS